MGAGLDSVVVIYKQDSCIKRNYPARKEPFRAGCTMEYYRTGLFWLLGRVRCLFFTVRYKFMNSRCGS